MKPAPALLALLLALAPVHAEGGTQGVATNDTPRMLRARIGRLFSPAAPNRPEPPPVPLETPRVLPPAAAAPGHGVLLRSDGARTVWRAGRAHHDHLPPERASALPDARKASACAASARNCAR